MQNISRSFPLLFSILIFNLGCSDSKSTVTLSGSLETWNKVTLVIHGPETSEYDKKNPFLDYRLDVLFVQDQDSFMVHGFYAADGKAAETSAREGNIWKVRFTTGKEGEWNYWIFFREGKNIAINDSVSAGRALELDGYSGKFIIKKKTENAHGFLGKGRLSYAGERYLKHAGSGEYFLKGGTDSPENFLAFEDFDNTSPNHRFEPHIADWNLGDPVWQDSKGKGIIGALNYLASKEMNVVYFLTMNVLGDGDDVYPWTGRNERYRFDCSKLDQWEIVFDHFDRLGILMHVVTQENENQVLLDAGFTDVQRKLYYRELVARFAHHLGVVWNMGEENGPANWFHNLGQSVQQREDMVEYLRKIDPYNNLIVFHTLPSDPEREDYTTPFLGNTNVDGISLQISNVFDIHEEVKKWITLTADSGRQWVVNLDEIGPWYRGLVADSEDPSHDTVRTQALWGTYMAGGAGTEWYLGPEDLTMEDFRTRNNMWDQTRIAKNFFTKNIPFYEMKSMDERVVNGKAWCFAKINEVYVIYLLEGNRVSVDLRDLKGEGTLSWLNPRTGKGEIEAGRIKGGGIAEIGPPPEDEDKDWAVIIRKSSNSNK